MPGDIQQNMYAELQRGRTEVQPSKFWLELNRRNESQLESTGFANFKRTVAGNYFTWIYIWPWDQQIRFLVSQLPWMTTVRNIFRTFKPPKHRHISLRASWAYNFLSNMVWDYVSRACTCLDKLTEPPIGNPPLIYRKGRLISQDLANSALEVDSILSGIPIKLNRVAELGAGYGRTAHALLSLVPNLRYLIIDIPPALYVCQQYLSAVYRNRKIFFWRPFNSYEEIREELESADLAFLLPSQMELLPDQFFDLFINISSLHEMRLEQILYYFSQIRRLLRQDGCFYLKEWKVSRIPLENAVIRQEDYPFSGWQMLFEREARIQTHFFEALLQKSPLRTSDEKLL